MVVPRDGDIAWVAADAHIGDPLVSRQAVERRMGLDEPAMALRVEQREDILATLGEHVELRGDLRQRPVKQGGLEDQQRADHLHPGGAALGRCADHDVAGPKHESVPARAVLGKRVIAWSGGTQRAHVLRP